MSILDNDLEKFGTEEGMEWLNDSVCEFGTDFNGFSLSREDLYHMISDYNGE